MNQRILKNAKRHFVRNKTDISVCHRKCSKNHKFLNAQNSFLKMPSFQFVLLIFPIETPILLREVTRDVFLLRASCQQTVLSVTALYVCQSHISVLYLVKNLAQCKTVLRQSAWQYRIIFFGMKMKSQQTLSSSHN
jgi:hypothetical protein